jgi:hypothetical protein
MEAQALAVCWRDGQPFRWPAAGCSDGSSGTVRRFAIFEHSSEFVAWVRSTAKETAHGPGALCGSTAIANLEVRLPGLSTVD